MADRGHTNSDKRSEGYKNNHSKDNIKSTISIDTETANKEKIKIAITSITASFILTIIKLAIGLFTNSLGLLSEALHRD